MFTKILLALVTIFAVFLVIVSMQPTDFRITRSATIEAPAAKVFIQVNDLHKWEFWSPWAKLDPNSKSSFEGPESGVGAAMSWDGNMKVGKGSMTIAKSTANEFIQFNMNFLKPMESVSTTEFEFKEEGGKTVVKWSMYGTNNFIGKAMGLIFNCEKIVGGSFEEGLNNLKTIVENNKKGTKNE